MNNSNYNSRLSRQLWTRCLLSLLAWALWTAAVAVLCYYIAAASSWDGTGVLYRFVNWAHRNVAPLYLLVTAAGGFVICLRFIARSLRCLDALVDAAQALSHPTEEPIALPAEMEQVQTQLNLAREQALRSALAVKDVEQRKNDLIVYLAHDLKTPLTSVVGYLTLLRDEPGLSPEFRARYTGVALDKAERLEDLIDEFFDITRFSLTHLELERRPIDLTRMLQQVADEFRPQLSEHGLTCALALPPSLICGCDPDKLARVFDNLLRNACHYSDPGTQVEIAAAVEEHTVLLTFTNRGATIPPEKLERVFDRFFRLDSSRAARTGGAGLGLAIAKEIVELHGGTISAHSGDGLTTFQVALPKS
ncbi:MAG: HAMP domain-containing histidine kinase [Oscillospiraceae bacterium]|nr:HAMP domain-containing histidine kinase [Oscillospiraceae bacterium]